MTDLYMRIVDFVSLAKRLEYKVRRKYQYQGESIYRGNIEKIIPYKGNITYEGVEYEFNFHGSGIDFKYDSGLLHYNYYAGKDGLGVYFTLQDIFEDFNYKITEEVRAEFRALVEQNLIKQWMPELPLSEVYYLV